TTSGPAPPGLPRQSFSLSFLAPRLVPFHPSDASVPEEVMEVCDIVRRLSLPLSLHEVFRRTPVAESGQINARSRVVREERGQRISQAEVAELAFARQIVSKLQGSDEGIHQGRIPLCGNDGVLAD